jgi:hypothetical protein
MYFGLYRDYEVFVKTLRRKSSYIYQKTHALTHTRTHSHTHKHTHTHTSALVSGHGGVQLDYHIIWKKQAFHFLYLVLCEISVR